MEPGIVRRFLDGFWNPDVWLPPNITWEDIKPSDKIQYTDYRDLLYPLPMAVIMLIVRFIFEKYCFAPFGTSLGIKSSKPKKAAPNEILERAYQQKLTTKHKEIVGLAKQLDWSERQVERWLRLRRAQEKPSLLTKFCENGWKCTYYTYSFIFGLVCLWDKPWLWNIDECWTDYPHQNVNNDIWWYYMISLAFYWSLMVSQFSDVKRKDFWQMFAHHVVTILLMDFSWVCNFHRIGSLVLLIHDCADIFLEAAKMTKYAKYQRTCDVIFGIFTVIWIVTRLGLYPLWILRSTTIEAPRIVNTMFPAYYIFNSMLFLLLVLHLFWTYLIIKIAINALYSGQMNGDIRSSSSDNVSDDSNASVPTANHNSTPTQESSQTAAEDDSAK